MACRWVHNTKDGYIKVYESIFMYKHYHKAIYFGSGIKIADLPPNLINDIGEMLESAYRQWNRAKYIKPKSKGVLGLIKKLIGK